MQIVVVNIRGDKIYEILMPKEAIIDYIKYYNEERIKLNLGGLSSVNYRKINRNKYK